MEPPLMLTALPSELLTHVCLLAACPCRLTSTSCLLTLVRASRTCKPLHECADAAALQLAESLGYDLDKGDPDWVRPDWSMLERLYTLYQSDNAARMPTAVHAFDGTAALSVLREQFGHFHPILCQQLVLPADASDQPRNEDTQQLPPGAAEYANLAALYCSAVPSQGAEQGADDEAPPGTREMQEWVEAGWAEGFDAEGRAHFGGELAGKSGEDAYIGATELLVALFHKRFRACIVEIDNDRPGHTIFNVAKKAFSFDEPACLPIFLQKDGHSFLIVGVTTCLTAADTGKLLVCDPNKPGRVIAIDPQLKLKGSRQYQLLIVLGREPFPNISREVCLTLNQQDGAGDDGTDLYPAGACVGRGMPQWRFGPFPSGRRTYRDLTPSIIWFERAMRSTPDWFTPTGFRCVYRMGGEDQSEFPYLVMVQRGKRNVNLGRFPTAEAAARSFAQSPEGQARLAAQHEDEVLPSLDTLALG